MAEMAAGDRRSSDEKIFRWRYESNPWCSFASSHR